MLNNASTVSAYVYAIGIIVIAFFAIAFLFLAFLFFKAKKKNIEHGLEDTDIAKDANALVKKLIRKKPNSSEKEIQELYQKKKKSEKILSWVSTGVFSVLFAFCIALASISLATKANGDQLFFGDTAMMIIQTDSMETAYKGNTYLADDFYGNERIEKRSFITITREKKYIDAIQPLDIVAFKMLSNDNETYITIVHRLIEVTQDSNNEPLYTFRGDANRSSMPGEFQIKKEMICGVYITDGFHGAYSVAFGYFMSYLQSNVGLIFVFIGFLLVFLYGALEDRLSLPYEKRFETILPGEISALVHRNNEIAFDEKGERE